MPIPGPDLVARIRSALLEGPLSETAIAARVDESIHSEILRTLLHRLRAQEVVIRDALLWRLAVMPPRAPVIATIVSASLPRHAPPMSESEKWCSSCKETKPRTQFYLRRRSHDGLQSHCKVCQTEQMRMQGNPISVEEKWCGNCRSTKPAQEFYRNRRSPDGLQPECRACKDEHIRSVHDSIVRVAVKSSNKPG